MGGKSSADRAFAVHLHMKRQNMEGGCRQQMLAGSAVNGRSICCVL